MERFFYSPAVENVLPENINENYLIQFSFNEKNIPHFAKTGRGIINKIYDDNFVEITINKNQTYFDTSVFGEGINLDSGLFLKSKYEDSDIVVFIIPKNYIWCATNEKV